MAERRYTIYKVVGTEREPLYTVLESELGSVLAKLSKSKHIYEVEPLGEE